MTTKRCRDTNFYASGEKLDSGAAWVVDPESGERFYVVSGRSRVSSGKVHVGSLAAGTRVHFGEDSASVLLNPTRLYGRRGRVPTALAEADRRRVVKISSRLALLLRHGARKAGLAMDNAGWAQREEVLAMLGCSEEDLTCAILY